MYKIHFLNVGHGDCVIVHYPFRVRKSDNYEKPERIMMVDINQNINHNDYEDVIKYYKNHFKDEDGNIKPIFRMICTHPHKDHITGLKQLFNDNKISIWNFWDTDNKFKPEEFEDDEHENDWNKYEDIRKSENNPKVIITNREDKPRKYWDDDEDRITIISPSSSIIENVHSKKEDGSKRAPHEINIDEISYSFLLKFNNIKVYLAGDGKEKCLNDIFDNCKTDLRNINVLRAGHHGQESGFHKELVKHMNPEHIIFSNSESDDKEYGAENLYKKELPNAVFLKTSKQGTIVLNIDFNDNYHFEDKFGNTI